MAKSNILKRTERGHANPWIIISRRMVDGWPQFDLHTLTEAAPTEEWALLYAEKRAQAGYWVEVYREHWYFAPQQSKED